MTIRTEKPRVLLVLGMHRSGTSAAARVANLLGANLGNNLIDPGPDNPDGFWEHAEAVRINEALLAGLGRTWYDMREMPAGWENTEAALEALAQIETLIRQDFPPGPLWIIKDPRLCLTAPIWIRALRGLGYDVDCLFVVRNPKEVVDSLHVRNNWVRGPLYLMWVQYLMEAEAASRQERRTLITYDGLLGDWRETMKRVALDLGFEWPTTLDAATAEVQVFLKNDRRHHVARPEDTARHDGNIPELADKLYRACLAISRSEKSWNVISRLEKTYRSVAGLYAEHIDQLTTQRWEAEARAQTAEARAAAHLGGHGDATHAYAELAEDINKSISGSHDLLAQKVGSIVNALAGGMDQLEQGFVDLQNDLRAKAHKDEEREVASEVRMGALESNFYDLSKRTAGVEVQVATLAGEVKVWDERQRSGLAELGATCTSLAGQFGSLRAEMQGQARDLGESVGQVASRIEQRLAALDSELKGHVRALVSEFDQRLVDLDAAFRASEQCKAESDASEEQRMEDIANEMRNRFHEMERTLGKQDVQVELLLAELSDRETKIHQFESSTSWRVTAPLRWIRKAFFLSTWKPLLGRALKSGYDRLPLAAHHRLALKATVFRVVAPLIRNTRSYRAWRAFEAHRGIGGADGARVAASASASLSPRRTETPESVGSSGLAKQVLAKLNEAASRTSDEYVAIDDTPADVSRIDVRAIAFYLPQFHPIPENDAWWGRGFTEWTNVSKAVPQFIGHYQPRLPGELGFYDLRVVDVMRRQVELAKHYGLQGFCFHYYWFGGRRLLERPLQQFLANADMDFPFCICWANENWSRRWDGMDQDVLIGQSHSPEDDIAFIAALEPLLRDPRYIRIDGKPLIVLYRPSILPDAKATQQRWREYCRTAGIGEIVLAMVQFDVEDPRVFGFDVAIEFPPHKLARGLDPINDQLQIINPDYSGYVVDYAAVIERARDHSVVDFDMIRGVFPSWDNEARKPGRGYTFAHATPERYREWLDLAVEYARKHPVGNERMIFINAWNEWAEGAHLEPDRRYGYAYLKQTRAALTAQSPVAKKRIVVVSHDAHPHGAQYLALNMAKALKQTFHFEVDVVLLGQGVLKGEFSRWARVHDLSGVDQSGEEALLAARALYQGGAHHAIANTTVSGMFARTLKSAGFNLVGLVHELPGVLNDNSLLGCAHALVRSADRLVFPAEVVREGFSTVTDVVRERTVIRPQGLYKLNRFASTKGKALARDELRARLGLKKDAKIVLCVGYADHRKGADLFVDLAKRILASREDIHFVWVGHFDLRLEPLIRDILQVEALTNHVHFVGREDDTDLFYAGSDVYALMSREDPFPSVVLEALQVAVPVIGFSGAGGFTSLLDEGAGICVPKEDVVAFAHAVRSLLADPAKAQTMGRRGCALIEEQYSFRGYLFDILAMLGLNLPRVSVVVPNYNYAHLLHGRLSSIVNQTVPFYELIILDDGSNDGSLEVIEEFGIKHAVHVRLVPSKRNSGSVFRQWLKGVNLASGDYVWIAEADDLCEPEFLSTILSAMTDPEVVMGYCQSKQIDENGKLISTDYLKYTDDVSDTHWNQGYRAVGSEEIKQCLAIKNTIPNVSAVVFRRGALSKSLTEQLDLMCSFRIAGDWLVYLSVLEQGDLVYIPGALNLHRRHGASVTLGSDRQAHMAEILRMQRLVRMRYPLSEGVLQKAEAYVSALCKYFNLQENEVAHLRVEIEQTPATKNSASGK